MARREQARDGVYGTTKEPSPTSRPDGSSANCNQSYPGDKTVQRRPTADAYQGPRSEGESTPAKPGN